METAGSREKVPEETAIAISFDNNGTYSSAVKKGIIKQKGKWTYDPHLHTLNIYGGEGKAASRILKLNPDELVLSEYTTINGEIKDSIVVTYKKN